MRGEGRERVIKSTTKKLVPLKGEPLLDTLPSVPSPQGRGSLYVVTLVISAVVIFIVASLLSSSPAVAADQDSFAAVPVPLNNPQTPEKVELGKKLFFDRRLSGDGTMSCATCHIPEQAFTDGQDISQSYPATKNWRNSPTLMNAAFYTFFFHDGRAKSLEDQALFPLMSPFEMNRNLDFVEEVLRSVPGYSAEFNTVFGGEVTRERIAMALAAFERTLLSRNVPLHRYLAGDATALSPEALKGYEIFRGKGKCISCHEGSFLSDNAFHALNVPENQDFVNDSGVAVTRRFFAKVFQYEDYRNLREDPGRYLVSKKKEDWKAFRTPTLLEISRTAPYMHNGVFKTLEEVIDFINVGGGPGNRELKPLGLSDDEKKVLKIFLIEALKGEDTVFTYPSLP